MGYEAKSKLPANAINIDEEVLSVSEDKGLTMAAGVIGWNTAAESGLVVNDPADPTAIEVFIDGESTGEFDPEGSAYLPVTNAMLADGAVTADKLDSNAVVEAKIANGAVTTDKIADGAVTAGKIAAEAVGTAKIADGAVTGVKILADAVTSAKIKDGAIITIKIADEAVEEAKIAANAVVTAKIADDAVIAGKIAANAVETAKINNGAVTAEKIDANAVIEAKIANDAVTTNKIKDGAVTAVKIVAGGVTTAKIADGAVTSAKLSLSQRCLASALYSFAEDGGAVGEIALTGDKIPEGAIVLKSMYEVLDGLTSEDAATVALGVAVDDADGILSATAFDNEALLAGLHDSGVNGAAENALPKTTGERTLIITIADHNLTAGAIRVFAEYVISPDLA